jgi:SAM-dependent methyltransferase
MESEWREYDRDYWDQRGGFDPLQAVLDEKDRPGRKNRYVDIVQKKALAEWYGGEATVLDLGCGTGRFLPWLADRSACIVGVEISERMLRVARDRGIRQPLVLYDGKRLPFRDAAYSGVVAVGVFQDLPEDPVYWDLIAETCRCLKPGGRLYLIEQVSDRESRRPWRAAAEVIKACSAAGLVFERKRGVRKGRWWPVPESLLQKVARWELKLREKEPTFIAHYMDFLFQFQKPGSPGGRLNDSCGTGSPRNPGGASTSSETS